MAENIIELKNISKSFKLGKWNNDNSNSSEHIIKSLDNISLSIEKQKMIGIIGKNGSGKTTLLRIMAGILQPDEGSLRVNGKVGPLLQIGAGSNEEYTVSENIILNGLLFGFKKDWIVQKVPEVLKFAELEEYKDVKMAYLSNGMKIRIMFSTGMLIDPDVLLVDEVISVGDDSFRKKSLDTFLSFKEKGKTIVFVSHNLPQVQELCDMVYMMDKGRIVESGDPLEVIKKYRTFCSVN